MKTRQLKLADLLQVQNGFAFKSELFCDTDRGLPLIRIRDLQNSSTEIHYDGPYREEFVVNPGDFLIGMDGDFRCYRWVGPRGLLNQRVCRLQGFMEGVEPDFIYHWIGSKLEAIHGTTAFVTVKHISSKQILNLDISLPPLDEQRRIVDILNHAASIRRLREQARAKAREIIPALFVEMFGDARANPKAWPVVHLETVASIGSGVTKGRKLDGAEIIEVPYLRVANVQDGRLNLAEIKTIPIRVDEREKYALRPGDLVMTEGGDSDKLGRSAIWKGEIEGCAHQNHVFRVRPDTEQILPDYLCALSCSRYGKRYFLTVAKQTTGIASINKTQLGRFPVILPPLELQQEFAERVAEVEGISSLNDRAATAAEQMAQSLLAQVFGPAT